MGQMAFMATQVALGLAMGHIVDSTLTRAFSEVNSEPTQPATQEVPIHFIPLPLQMGPCASEIKQFLNGSNTPVPVPELQLCPGAVQVQPRSKLPALKRWGQICANWWASPATTFLHFTDVRSYTCSWDWG
ncbi:unnamed protein product [Gulo gulo]|uniref:SRCR domain-containing protein n=1 Tax=Gulo gulo TaxID=48420 RepID=A0A9X9LVM3_GULGU|nr:unnamed protein product [Gulo gulo]